MSARTEFEVPTTEAESSSSQPPNFHSHLQLLPHQLKSLSWMESQERAVDGGRLTRGGVLADRIGTGKTCISLALIDKARCEQVNMASTCFKLPSPATLVIVPPNICDQWSREVNKFIRSGSVRIFLAQEIGELKSWTLRNIAKDADIVVVSYRIFASKSYGPRRRHLESCEGELGEMEDARFPVFEIFHFNRIIADEFHELVEAASSSRPHPFREAMQALCRMQSTHRWGITSTPPLDSVRSIISMASFFHVKLAASYEDAAEFVARFVRRNTVEPARVSLIQRKVLVSQTIHERALYLLRRREGASSEDLLSYASVHWSWSAEHDDRTECRTAQEICKAKLQDLYRPIVEKEERLKEVIVKLRSTGACRSVRQILGAEVEHELGNHDGCKKALESLAHFLEDHRLEKHITQARRAGEKKLHNKTHSRGTCEDVLALIKMLGKDYTTLLFFENSLDESDTGIECPICLNHLGRDDCSIAKCGHKACTDCWSHVLKTDPRCPICREAVGESLISLSASTRPTRWTPNADPEIQGTQFGSKVACLLETLSAIQTQEPTAKILVFCQFEELKIKIMRAFKKLAVPHLKLEGSTADRTQTVRTFISPGGPATLLASMAVSPSGLDLSMANHVIIVQPTWHDDCDIKSVDFEAQAIGRCWRMGQERPVFVYRLCMANTVEEALVDSHLHLWSAKFGALQQ